LAEGRRRLPINILSNFTWLVLNAIVGLWYTPYLIGHLGVAVYGLIPLASSAVSYMTIVTTGLNDAIGRFLTIDLAREEPDAANRTFNTAIVGSLIVVAVLALAALVVSWQTPRLFAIPPGHERDAQWLILLTASAFLITTFASSFAISSYAHHRFDLRLLVNVARLGGQVGGIVLLFTWFPPHLWHVGLATCLAAFLFLLGHRNLWRKLTPELRFEPGLFDAARLGQMLGFSGWVLVNMVGATLFLNIDLILANRIFGAEVAGRYGAVILFPTLLRSLVGTINGVLSPIVVTLYARHRLSDLARFSRLSVKFMGLAVALPIGLLGGLGKPLLEVWLGAEFVDLSWLLIALVGHLCINVAVVPLFSLQVAANKVRTPGLVTLSMGLVNVGLAVALALWSGWGYVGIAVAGAVVLTAKNAVFTPLYNARILKLPWWSFLPSLLAGAVGCLAVGVGAYWIAETWALTDWSRLALVAALTGVLYVIAAYFLGLSPNERRSLHEELRRRVVVK
jgi:membrane protein EpsK